MSKHAYGCSIPAERACTVCPLSAQRLRCPRAGNLYAFITGCSRLAFSINPLLSLFYATVPLRELIITKINDDFRQQHKELNIPAQSWDRRDTLHAPWQVLCNDLNRNTLTAGLQSLFQVPPTLDQINVIRSKYSHWLGKTIWFAIQACSELASGHGRSV